jgi:xanthine dehydrogenase YagS FAD-binding subunit
MKPFAYITPAGIPQALSRKNADARFLAGGTNLVDLMKKDIEQPDTLLPVGHLLPQTITVTTKGLSIGAMARNSAVAADAQVKAAYPLVSKAILAGASPQIRNMASTAGNLLQRTRCPYFYDVTLACNKRKPGSGCSALQGNNRMHAIVGWSNDCIAVHPSDFCVALAALDATVTVTNRQQARQVIPFKDFHRLPGNEPQRDNHLPADALVASVDIPANPFRQQVAYLKVRDRDSYAFALVSVAAALHIERNTIVSARLASGGVAHKPWRWYEAEAYLKGKAPEARHFSAAAAIVAGSLKPLPGNRFKVPLLTGAIETALQQSLHPTNS